MPHLTRKKRLPSNPDIPPVRNNIKPGDDFYIHINGNWLRHVKMPSYLSSYGVSEEIEKIIDNELLEILNDSKNAIEKIPDKSIPHTKYLLGTLSESVINTSSQSLNVKLLYDMISRLKCIRDINDIVSTLGDFIKHRIPTTLSFSVNPMETESTHLKLTISPGNLGLPDINYYKPNSGKARIINAYIHLLKILGKDFDVPELEQVFGIEELIAASIYKSREDDDVIMKGSELKVKYKNIPWDILMQSTLNWTPSKFNNHSIIITSTHYLQALNKWLYLFPLSTWKIIFTSQILMYMLPLLPPPYDDWEFQLFGKRMRGQTEKLPQHLLALHLAKQWLGGSLGSAFIDNYVPPIVKRNAYSVAKEIKEAAIEVAGSTQWLEASTRKKASEKVKSIYLGIAYPKIIKKDIKTKLYKEKIITNILHLGEIDFQDEIKKIGKKLHADEWDDDVFAVNAYYYNEGNRLILPAGILKWPFFHPNASDGWNFGGIGATIGHEISHAFDNDGKDYDEHGNRNPWWSQKEEERYQKKTSALINLYNKTSYFGHHLNGVLTLSENIADLGGLHIALSALKNRLSKRKVTPSEYKKELCDFFTSFAVSWRTKEKKQKAFQSLFMDVHAPPPSRVNNIVSQFDEWYECFDVKVEDKLYKDPIERIRIF